MDGRGREGERERITSPPGGRFGKSQACQGAHSALELGFGCQGSDQGQSVSMRNIMHKEGGVCGVSGRDILELI